MPRVLVIKLSSLGDLAHALPAVRTLQVRTGATLDWVVQPEYANLIACVPDVARIIPFPRRNLAQGFFQFKNLLRAEHYDLVVDFQGLLKSALIGRLARADWRVGPAWAREGAHWFYDAQAEAAPGPRGHAVDELLALVDSVAPGEGPPPAIPLNIPEAEPDHHPGPHVAFAPFSRWATKNWPLEKFAELGVKLSTEMGCQIRIVGGPADADDGEALAHQIGARARNLCGKTDLVGLCSLLKSMDLLVSVDSGPLHWADALGVPVVAIYGATDPARTGPYHQPQHVVAKEGLDCRPCHSRQCSREDMACLHTLDVEAVWQAALAQL